MLISRFVCWISYNWMKNNKFLFQQNQLTEKHIIRIPPTVQLQPEQFSAILLSSVSSEIDSIVDEHISKFQIPYCTYGVDRRLLLELEEVNRYSRTLGQNCANFSIMDRIKRFVLGVFLFVIRFLTFFLF